MEKLLTIVDTDKTKIEIFVDLQISFNIPAKLVFYRVCNLCPMHRSFYKFEEALEHCVKQGIDLLEAEKKGILNLINNQKSKDSNLKHKYRKITKNIQKLKNLNYLYTKDF